MAEKLYIVSETTVREYRRLKRKLDTLVGKGVTNAPDSVSINPPMPRPGQNDSGRRTPRPFLARVTGNASLDTHKWKYAWTEVQRDGDGVADKPNGRSGTTTTDYAINLAEINHTATYAWGVDVTADDYPAGFAPRPVGGGGAADTHRTDEVVEMTQTVDVNGAKKFHFRAMGSHDGTCAP